MRLNNTTGTNQDQLLLKSDYEKTIGSGKDYTTITSAIADLEGKLVSNAKFTIDAGTYNEKIIDGTENLLCSTLELIGDTRSIVGSTYVDGIAIQTSATSGGGVGTCAISLTDDTITITGTTTNPNFETAGIVAGDKVQCLLNNDSIAEYEVSSVSENTITMTTTPGAIGDDGTTLTILANRVISLDNTILKVVIESSLHPSLAVSLKGFTFKKTGAGVNSIVIQNNALPILLSNCVFDGGGYSGTIFVLYNSSSICNLANSLTFLNSTNYAFSIWRKGYVNFEGANVIQTIGINITEESYGRLNYNRWIAGSSTNPIAYVQGKSSIRNDYSVILGYYRGIYCSEKSYIYAGSVTIKGSNIGIYTLKNSYVNAPSTVAKMSDNTANYSPVDSDTVGNVGSYITYS